MRGSGAYTNRINVHLSEEMPVIAESTNVFVIEKSDGSVVKSYMMYW